MRSISPIHEPVQLTDVVVGGGGGGGGMYKLAPEENQTNPKLQFQLLSHKHPFCLVLFFLHSQTPIFHIVPAYKR